MCITRNLRAGEGRGQRKEVNIQLLPPKPYFQLGKSLRRGDSHSVSCGIWGSPDLRLVGSAVLCVHTAHGNPVCTHITHTHVCPRRSPHLPGLSAASQLPLLGFLETWDPGSRPSTWPPQDHSDNERKCGHQLTEDWGFRLRLQATTP